MSSEHPRALLRVDWRPGSDSLTGTCHCGAVHLADGPAEVWDWLLAHPEGHTAATAPPTTAPPTTAPPSTAPTTELTELTELTGVHR
ncbi:MAG TPA: hypothetical protein VH141_16455 [Pseudonocardia sp.]|nr:hypothetical protein [Pseudonocardia sp.]